MSFFVEDAEVDPVKRAFSPKAGDAIALQGVIDSVRQVNPSTGWGFGRLYIKEKRIAVPFTGDVQDAYEGADVQLAGTWMEHRKFGWQLKATAVQVELASTANGVAAWLAHRMPDVGPVIAGRLVTHFDTDELWDVIENASHRLREVDGLGEHLEHGIVEAYAVFKHEREQFAGLAALGLKPPQIRAAIRLWAADALLTITDNPYVLMQLPGVGFKQADAIAMRNGMKRADPRRIHAGLVLAAVTGERDGHTCHRENKLTSIACGKDLLSLAPRLVRPHFASAVKAGLLKQASTGFYLPATLQAELDIADGVAALLDPERANS